MEKINIVGGGGHVGLPLGLVLASVGYKVTAFDTSEETIQMLKNGILPFKESNANELLETHANKNLVFSSNIESISDAEIVIIVIGTPVDEFLSPNPNSLLDVVKKIIPFLNDNQLVILRSTVFPGVTNKVIKILQQNFPGICVAYCPERIIEGNAIEELKILPQIIGTENSETYLRASKIFNTLGVDTIQSLPQEAELAKLFTNVWRYIKFATANQFFMIANDLGVDYENVRNIISFNYPRASDLPKSGLTAGPCLFKDTMQLSALMNQKFMLGHSAMLINEGIPNYIVERLRIKYDLKNLKVGILGMAFKGEVDDIRGSLAYKLRKLLMFESKEVFATDEYVLDERLISLQSVLEKSDILIIGAPHKRYCEINYQKPVIDIWDLLGNGVLI